MHVKKLSGPGNLYSQKTGSVDRFTGINRFPVVRAITLDEGKIKVHFFIKNNLEVQSLYEILSCIFLHKIFDQQLKLICIT